MNYEHIMSFVSETPWAIIPSKLLAIMNLLNFRVNGGHFTAEEIEARIGATRTPPQQAGTIAVLPLYGTIIPRGNFLQSSGTTSIEGFTKIFRQAMADSSIGGIIIDVDSGGGAVQSVQELTDEIYAARGVKPVTAIANGMAASAAYWIASACERMMVTPSGDVGSIGVFGTHQDVSKMCEMMGVKNTLISAGKYKVEGNPFEELTDEARAAMQARVNDYYESFTQAVARNRNVKLESVTNGMGEGRIVGAKQALKMGMVDAVGSLDDAIEDMMKRMNKPMMSAESTNNEIRVGEGFTSEQVDALKTEWAQQYVGEEKADVEILPDDMVFVSTSDDLDLRRRRLELNRGN